MEAALAMALSFLVRYSVNRRGRIPVSGARGEQMTKAAPECAAHLRISNADEVLFDSELKYPTSKAHVPRLIDPWKDVRQFIASSRDVT